MALVALGALAWSGCSVQAHGGGDVYCDKTGCYECSGFSCGPTSGPGETSSGAQVTVDSGPVATIDSGNADAVADGSGADAAPPPDCTTTSDCRADVAQACVSGYCRYTCTTNAECAEIDARLDTCNGDDASPGYCVSSSE